MKKDVKVRVWAKFLPAYIWTIILDGLDLLSMPLSIFPIIGELWGLSVDTLQIMLAFAIFDDPIMWVAGGVEFALPQPLDVFPTFTGRYILATLNIV